MPASVLTIFLHCTGSILLNKESSIEKPVMKRFFILFSTLLLFLLTVSSCSHDTEKPANKAAKGQWQWEYSAGGVGGYSLQPINNTLITLSLNNDSTYDFYLNNEVQISGKYSIQAATNGSLLHFDDRIQINLLSMQQDQTIIKWDSQKLQLLDGDISDGYNHYFKKIN